jgi:CheY-like chemotaxis protein
MDGIDCVRQLSERLPELQIVMLTVTRTQQSFPRPGGGRARVPCQAARARDLLAAIRTSPRRRADDQRIGA